MTSPHQSEAAPNRRNNQGAQALLTIVALGAATVIKARRRSRGKPGTERAIDATSGDPYRPFMDFALGTLIPGKSDDLADVGARLEHTAQLLEQADLTADQRAALMRQYDTLSRQQGQEFSTLNWMQQTVQQIMQDRLNTNSSIIRNSL